MQDVIVTDTLTIPASELVWTATRASGPGGQNVNKVATKVELRWDLPGSTALHPAAKDRLRALAGTQRLDADGKLVLLSQATRSQERNLADVCDKLADLVRRSLVPPKPRRKTRPTKASQERRHEAKRHQAEKKLGRGSIKD